MVFRKYFKVTEYYRYKFKQMIGISYIEWFKKTHKGKFGNFSTIFVETLEEDLSFTFNVLDIRFAQHSRVNCVKKNFSVTSIRRFFQNFQGFPVIFIIHEMST